MYWVVMRRMGRSDGSFLTGHMWLIRIGPHGAPDTLKMTGAPRELLYVIAVWRGQANKQGKEERQKSRTPVTGPVQAGHKSSSDVNDSGVLKAFASAHSWAVPQRGHQGFKKTRTHPNGNNITLQWPDPEPVARMHVQGTVHIHQRAHETRISWGQDPYLQ